MRILITMLLLCYPVCLSAQEISTVELWNEFKASEPVFEKKYRDRQVIVTGKMLSSRYDPDGLEITLNAGLLTMVTCRFHRSHTAAVQAIGEGDLVRVSGYYNSKMLTILIFDRCEMVE